MHSLANFIHKISDTRKGMGNFVVAGGFAVGTFDCDLNGRVSAGPFKEKLVFDHQP